MCQNSFPAEIILSHVLGSAFLPALTHPPGSVPVVPLSVPVHNSSGSSPTADRTNPPPLGKAASFTMRAVPVPHDMQIALLCQDDLYIPIQGQKLLKNFKHLFICQHRSLDSFLTSFYLAAHPISAIAWAGFFRRFLEAFPY